MKLTTTRFGDIEVGDERVIHFPEGIPGFPEDQQFVLIHSDDNPSVHWLQSTTQPHVALIIMDPLTLDPNYNIDISQDELAPIDPGEEPERTVLCRVIVRKGETEGELYANLLAPLLFNVEKKLGMQVPLVDSRYSVREVFPRRPAA